MEVSARRRRALAAVRFGTILRSAIVAVFGLLLFPSWVAAQSNVNGYIYGEVDDAGKGATVEARSAQTGVARSVKVDSEGRFNIQALPVGIYKVKATTPDGKITEKEVSVNVGVGSLARLYFTTAELGEVTVTGSAVNPIDFSQTESVTILSYRQVEKMPIARNQTSVALLSPGTVIGGSAANVKFATLPSFGGGSVQDNTYYLNGFNLTDMARYVGSSDVPFEFFQEFQVRTGGYSSEFGRSIGGVINAVTKRGGPDITTGTSVYWAPDGLSGHPDSVTLSNGSIIPDNRQNYDSRLANAYWLSGPLEPNTNAYGYALVEFHNDPSRGVQDRSTNTYEENTDRDPFYGVKLDWEAFPGHAFEFTGFSDDRDTKRKVFNFDQPNNAVKGIKVNEVLGLGGHVAIFRYTGQITDTFSVSALLGRGSRKNTDTQSSPSGTPCVIATDARPASPTFGGFLGCATAREAAELNVRKAQRLDFNWRLAGHSLKFGFDREDNQSDIATFNPGLTGGFQYSYRNSGATGVLPNGAVIAPNSDFVRLRIFKLGGHVKGVDTAQYIEDNWQLTDRLLLTLGLRNETFNNFNIAGQSFIKFNNQLAPRLGASFDLFGDGSSKIFTNYGRYYLPVVNNTNAREAGGQVDRFEFWTFSTINADGTPNLVAKQNPDIVQGAGLVDPPTALVSKNIKPMYQDEIILGFQKAFDNHLAAGTRIIYRRLGRAVEDECSSALVPASNTVGCMLFNPGYDIVFQTDTVDGNGNPRPGGVIPASTIGFPKAQRFYKAIELFAEQTLAEKWFWQGSYTFSHLTGNYEGYAKSDNGQDDAGISSSFDLPELTHNSDGPLPNDVRHKLKLFGGYSPVESTLLGLNLQVNSGRPLNRIGIHPSANPQLTGYEGEAFFVNGVPSPRGSHGRTPWIIDVSVSAQYTPEFFHNNLKLGLDVFNILNRSSATSVIERCETTAIGVLQPACGQPAVFQAPISTRLSARYEFK